MSTDTDVVFDPASYVRRVPFDALSRLRQHAPVTWVDEKPVLGWPGGPGFWLVLRHADVQEVMTSPQRYSSAKGGTQIRDPATPRALAYVRRMMLNMDPPEHSRLRRLLSRSFTPRAIAQLEDRIRGHARAICERAFAGPKGECDFAKDVAAVDEMLRWWTPVMTFRRTATADCELGGQRIRENDKVVVSFTAANRDPAVFTNPDAFDILRTPNPHLTFGHGPHFCLGAHLARVQMRARFDEVLTRTQTMDYAGQPEFLRSNFQRGVKTLPIAWTASLRYAVTAPHGCLYAEHP
jgi:cytochrome P450